MSDFLRENLDPKTYDAWVSYKAVIQSEGRGRNNRIDMQGLANIVTELALLVSNLVADNAVMRKQLGELRARADAGTTPPVRD